jgi:hypothetical protein
VKKRVLDLGKSLIKKMDLESWDITFVVSKKNNNNGAAAECNPNPRYKFATITIYKTAFDKPNDLEHVIKHELSHCITQSLYEYCYDFLNGKFHAPDDIEFHREQMTDWIARIVK